MGSNIPITAKLLAQEKHLMNDKTVGQRILERLLDFSAKLKKGTLLSETKVRIVNGKIEKVVVSRKRTGTKRTGTKRSK